ncbi:MAG: ATP synthase F1 subunit delta [Spirochaetaceae bacterium]|nr:ATP synthase F1 subunit delta [Spirochaetaceae bacterium]
MKNLIIAKRYSKALFNLGLEAGLVERYGQEMGAFITLMRDFPDLADAVQNPLYPEATRAALFFAVAEKVGLSPVVKSFINLLIEKGRVQHLGEIAEYYDRLIDEHDNVARAQVSTAIKLGKEALGDIEQMLGKMTGKKVVVDFEMDPGLIGGILVKIGDLVLDGSVKRELLNFKESLKRGALG